MSDAAAATTTVADDAVILVRLAEARARARAGLRLRAAAFFVYLATLTILLTLPGHRLPRAVLRFSDKWQHGAAFLALGILLWRWIVAWRPDLPAWKQWLVVVIVAALFGTATEIAQLYVPRRTFDGRDIAWNVLGGIVSGSVAVWPRALRRWLGG